VPNDTLKADVEVRIDGHAVGGVTGVAVRRDVWAPGVCEVRLSGASKDFESFLSGTSKLDVGSPVEIDMGYTGRLKPVMTGEITGFELEVRSGGKELTVCVHEPGHRLLRGRKTRPFRQKTDRQIALEVADQAGFELGPQAKDTGVILEYVLQHNQTDWEFLQQRARHLGYELRVEGRTLFFQEPGNNSTKELTLELEGSALLEFRPRLSTVGLVGEVVVQGWNPRDKEAITGKASSKSQGRQMGGSRSGLAITDEKFGPARGTIVDRPVLSQAEADQIARGRLGDMALAYITGEGVVIGRNDLAPGRVVEIKGFGKTFSGLYYLVSVRHTFDVKNRGYRTAFAVRRNAS
jgi:phage protein D